MLMRLNPENSHVPTAWAGMGWEVGQMKTGHFWRVLVTEKVRQSSQMLTVLIQIRTGDWEGKQTILGKP